MWKDNDEYWNTYLSNGKEGRRVKRKIKMIILILLYHFGSLDQITHIKKDMIYR